MNNNSSIRWRNTGELMFDDKTIPNTNIKELVYSAVQKGSSHLKPNGWNDFRGALSALNAPTKFIKEKQSKKKTLKQIKWGTLQIAYYDTKTLEVLVESKG